MGPLLENQKLIQFKPGCGVSPNNIDRSLLVDINRLKSPKVKKEFKQITCDYIT